MREKVPVSSMVMIGLCFLAAGFVPEPQESDPLAVIEAANRQEVAQRIRQPGAFRRQYEEDLRDVRLREERNELRILFAGFDVDSPEALRKAGIRTAGARP